jgi:hypothetical protein
MIRTYESWAKKHFSQLIGYKKGNKAFQVAISQDEEGNGGGHLFIEDYKTD